jgi:hypothetical protein
VHFAFEAFEGVAATTDPPFGTTGGGETTTEFPLLTGATRGAETMTEPPLLTGTTGEVCFTAPPKAFGFLGPPTALWAKAG